MTYLLAAVDGLPQQPIELDQGPPPVNAITMGEAAEADQQAKVDEARNKAWIRGLLVGGGAIGAASYLMKTRKYQLLQDQLTCIKNSVGVAESPPGENRGQAGTDSWADRTSSWKPWTRSPTRS